MWWRPSQTWLVRTRARLKQAAEKLGGAGTTVEERRFSAA